MEDYDVIVVGAGHAGSEAAWSAATMGSRVLLVTMDMAKIAQMSCNPAMGGIAKGQIVREIDALGGMSGWVTDKSMIQFRMLNRSKGPAMWSPRAQCDRMMFSLEWRGVLEKNRNIDFWQDTVEEIKIENNRVQGIVTKLGIEFKAKTVILTSGTFMNGLIHVGKKNLEGGRAGEPASKGISPQFRSMGIRVGRMKTGTPARIDGRTVDFSKLIEQLGDRDGGAFSFLSSGKPLKNQMPCYIAHTHPGVHDIIREGIKYSPLFDGTIQSIGPRYCPSIEDKVVTFSGKDQHQLFLEPEGWKTIEYYINGFSSSLPMAVQYEAMKKIPGLEKVKIFRPGYAIEYDYFDPTQLHATLEFRGIEGLFLAGQVNGTTGYEEAAAQGLIAGINAHRKVKNDHEFILARDEAYIGVLIDDLVTKGVDEPYRMFTSRAEYRMLLRQDNADERLTAKGYAIGLAGKNRLKKMEEKYRKRNELVEIMEQLSVKKEEVNTYLEKAGTSPIRQTQKAITLIGRPEVKLDEFIKNTDSISMLIQDHYQVEIIEAAEIYIKYKGYTEREKMLADKMKRLEEVKIRRDMDYSQLKSLSTEARQKLSKFRPETIGQAKRISGISPSDINVLLVYLGR